MLDYKNVHAEWNLTLVFCRSASDLNQQLVRKSINKTCYLLSYK